MKKAQVTIRLYWWFSFWLTVYFTWCYCFDNLFLV